MSIPGPNLAPSIHTAALDDREPRRRPKMFFFDRIKLLLIIAIILTLTTMYKGQQVGLMSVGDAVRDQ